MSLASSTRSSARSKRIGLSKAFGIYASHAPILLEGYTVDEILALPTQDLKAIVLSNEPLVFMAGSANLLGRFVVTSDSLVIELAHVDGGGEGALPSLASLVSRYARREGLAFVEWRVHAVHCARPNLKVRRVLERRGFVVREFEGVGQCYWLRASAGDG